MIMRVIGIALILAGASIYMFPERLITYVDPTSIWILLIAGVPVIAGIGLIVVGAGMAKLAVRIAGILLVISALAGLGVIAL
jgi:membrane protein YqaA with SNARE-associated domain